MVNSILSSTLIVCILWTVCFPVCSAADNSNSDTESFFDLPEVLSIGFMVGAIALSPYGKMRREIYELKQDQLFIRRHLMINQDPLFQKRTYSVLEITREKERQAKKKLRRFSYWFFPSLVVATTGVGLLADWALD